VQLVPHKQFWISQTQV